MHHHHHQCSAKQTVIVVDTGMHLKPMHLYSINCFNAVLTNGVQIMHV